jgi:ketosteroid isomerase-like protein
MKRKLALVLIVAATISMALGQTENNQGKTKRDSKTSLEQMFTKMENEWAQADNKKDTAVLDRILADDWTYLGPEGVVTKAQHLAELKSGGGGLEFETLADVKVRVFGETAVVTGSAFQKNSTTDKGKDTSGHYVWTDVFVKRQGRWQAVNSQDTRMSHE